MWRGGVSGRSGRYFLFILQTRKLSRPDRVIDPMICINTGCLASSPVHKKYIKMKYVLLFSFLNWSVFALQCCVSFRCIAKWFSCMYISFLQYFSRTSYYKTEYSSLYQMLGSCWLPILYIVVCVCSSQTTHLSPPTASAFGNHKVFFCRSISVSYTSSFVSFKIPHISDIIWYLSFPV